MKPSRLYRIATLAPSLSALILIAGFELFISPDYKSEWMTKEAWTTITTLVTVIAIFMQLILLLPILLINHSFFQKHPIRKLLLFLPLWSLHILLLNDNNACINTKLSYFLMISPFFIGSIVVLVKANKS